MVAQKSSKHSFDDLRALVANGEIGLALEGVKELLSAQSIRPSEMLPRPRLLTEVTAQMARLSLSKSDRRRNLISQDHFERTISQIAFAVTELIDELQSAIPSQWTPAAQPDVTLSDAARETLEVILGPISRLKSLWWLRQALKCAGSVCRVVSPRGLGTGFVVERNVLVTNNHVIKTLDDAFKAFVEFNFEEDESGNLMQVAQYSLDPDTFYTNASLDCTTVAIVRDETSPPLQKWGALRMERKHPIEVMDHVTIIQHPRGGTKQVCLTENKVVNIFGSRIQYTTDTMPGSSGSPVFNDQWNVIAVHHAGGNLVSNSRGDRIFANEGVLISSLLCDSSFKKIFGQS